MMRGSNMGILPYGLILLVTWGLGHIRTIATPLDRHEATRKITWGLGRVRTIATPENYLGPKRVLQKNNSNIGTH